MSTIKENRFESVFNYILNKRLVPFVEDNINDIFNDVNFTNYYKEEIIGNEHFIRPIFDLSKYDVIIISIIVDELNNPEFIEEFNTNIIPINTKLFFEWLKVFLIEKNILFHINRGNDTLCFYTVLILDYNLIRGTIFKLLH